MFTRSCGPCQMPEGLPSLDSPGSGSAWTCSPTAARRDFQTRCGWLARDPGPAWQWGERTAFGQAVRLHAPASPPRLCLFERSRLFAGRLLAGRLFGCRWTRRRVCTLKPPAIASRTKTLAVRCRGRRCRCRCRCRCRRPGHPVGRGSGQCRHFRRRNPAILAAAGPSARRGGQALRMTRARRGLTAQRGGGLESRCP